MRCTTEGRRLVDEFRTAEADWTQNATAQALAALRQKNFEQASMAVSRSGKADARDCRILHFIFSTLLPRHAKFDERHLTNLRVAAGMTQLWGTNRASPYIEQLLRFEEIDWNLECRLLWSAAMEANRLEEFKAVGIKRVQVLGSDDCPVCAADNKKIYDIDSAPKLPHENCACDGGCVCMFTTV